LPVKKQPLTDMRTSLFITCYNDTLYPETGRAVVRLLERLGVTVEFNAGQTCCGQMHANTGFRGEAFSQAKRLVRLYQDAETVVIPSSSCVAMIRDQYPLLFDELGNDAVRRDFATLMPRIYELSEFLIDKLGVDDVGAYFPHRVTYHASCHGLRGLHLGDRPFRLLAKVRGLAVKLQDIAATGAEYCTALDNSCLMHLGGAMHRQYAGMKTIHMAQILASTETTPAEVFA
jgi:L-lactate dehydrogenase complex protein LldE